MTKKIGDKKVTAVKTGDVKSTEAADHVKGSGEVGAVGAVKSAGSVSGAGAAGGVGGNKRRPTVVMSYAEREQLFKMVSEEATKLFSGSKMSGEKQKLVAEAVKMAIDSGLLGDPAQGGARELTPAEKKELEKK
jgi:hypothetical protein